MREKLRFLGLDVHAETIAVAVAEANGEVRSLGTIANREDSIRKFIKKLGSPEQLRACYEAGPTGFALYWQLTQLGVDCAVVAPSLVPKKPGDRVKTDRRDALKLARCHRSGDLTAVWVPNEASEALRDLVRQREAAKQDQLRVRHRLTKLLLRTGQRPPLGLKPWTERYWRWLGQVRYAQPAQEVTRLDCMNEVEHMSARVKRLEEAILEVVKVAPQALHIAELTLSFVVFGAPILRKALAVLLLLALLMSPAPSHAWGYTGHEAVAFVAWRQLTPATRARVLVLLRMVPTLHNPDGTDTIPGYADWVSDLPSGLTEDQKNQYLFMRAATWADTIKLYWLKTSYAPPPNRTVEVNIGYTDPESHAYWHFIDIPFTSDNLPPAPAPNIETQIIALRRDIASDEDDLLKSYNLVWLLHLVGDIHQPLHVITRYFAAKGDKGGNDVKIRLTPAMTKRFEGTPSKSGPTNLHFFWDDLPGEAQPGPALPQAAAYAARLPSPAAALVAISDPTRWADESFSLAKRDAYSAPIGKSPQPPASSGTSSYLITKAYYNKAMTDARSRIALAGARLAKLLNENLK